MYVLESNLELYARDILFLSLALEKRCRMGLQGTLLTIAYLPRSPNDCSFYPLESRYLSVSLDPLCNIIDTCGIVSCAKTGYLVFFAEKMETFLELFGNCHVRQQAMDYVEEMAHEFIK